MDPKTPQVVIVGAGPAGMLLAYLLASQGIAVRVLERHPDFEREFRGELIQPVVVQSLQALGIVDELVKRELALPAIERRLFVGATRRVQVPGGNQLGSLISQPGLLALLHEACGRFPHYRMDFRTVATDLRHAGDRVTGVQTRCEGVEGEVAADLVIVCAGRNTGLRKAAGIEVESFQTPADVLWLRVDLSEQPDAMPAGVDVHMFGKGVVTVLSPTTRHRLQVAYSAPGQLAALKNDLPLLRKRLLPTVPRALRPLIDARLEVAETAILRVAVDRLKSWHRPGILFLGDAAHTMSPAGGTGLNVAMRDAIVTANHLIQAVRDGRPLDAAVLQPIEDARKAEVEALQAAQVRIHRAVMAPLLVQHLMFTAMGLVLKVKKNLGTSGTLPPLEPTFPVPLA